MEIRRLCLFGFMFIFLSCNSNEKEEKKAPISKQGQSISGKSGERKQNDTISVDGNDSFNAPPYESLSLEDKIEYYRSKENYTKAIAITDSIINDDPSNYRWWSIKGMLYYENNDTTNAIAAYEKANTILPIAEDRLNLALLYAGKGNSKCISITRELTSSGKGSLNPKIYFINGVYNNKLGKKEKAIEFFDLAIREQFTFMEAYKEKALILCDINRCIEGINTLIKAVTIQNTYQDGYYYLGQCYEKIGELDKAIESYQTALMYNSKDEDAEDCLNRLTKEKP